MTGSLEPLRHLVSNGFSGRRFTQSSPILPDVWIAYGANPRAPQELLLTPERAGRAEVIAATLRERVGRFRRKTGDGVRRRPAKASREAPDIACIPELVAAKLYFDEIITLVLSSTAWWKTHIETAVGAGSDGIRLSDAQITAIGADIDRLVAADDRFIDPPRASQFSCDFLWLVAVVGAIRRPSAFQDGKCDGERLARAFAEVLACRAPFDTAVAEGGAVWRASLNRPVEHATLASSLAIKADAARLLFNISCAKITFAVLDSGIDQRHPAFRDWAKPDEPAANRIDRTYDFTEVRALLNPATAHALLTADPATLDERQRAFADRLRANLEARGVGDVDTNGPRHIAQLRDRLEMGLEIDWGLLEPFLHDLDPAPPADSHGTHVAGILGADWREGADGEEPTVHMQGICPDIRIFDIRVLSPGTRVKEFEVIAALQFIAHLNRRADAQVVHGANMSLETLHNVTNYACGSTPICEACNSLWASGVVLVAAAGNHGHQRYTLASGEELGGYHAISITDPGNADGVITVGATHRKAHQYGVSYFSSRGPTGDGRRKPDLVAPGERVDGPALHGSETAGNGTSFAAPHASGAAALLMARFEELRGQPQRIKTILCDTATDLGREPYFQGAGMLDILRALQSI